MKRDQTMRENSLMTQEAVDAAEAEGRRELLNRAERVHFDALYALTEQVDKLLAVWEDDPEAQGHMMSIPALSIISTFATLRNALANACIAKVGG